MRSVDRSVAGRDRSDADALRVLELLKLRGSPKFFIVDRCGRVIFCSSELVDSALLANGQRLVEGLFARYATVAAPTFERLDAVVMLRIVPVAGERSECYAVFMEPVSSRNSLESAVKRYTLSKREAEVLEHLLGGFSTAQIAQRLFITEGTVGDHVKGLFRKTRTNKRSDLVARVFHFEHDNQRGPRAPAVPPEKPAATPTTACLKGEEASASRR